MNQYLNTIKPYSKALAAVVATILIALNFAYGDSQITSIEWVTVAIQGVGAASVFAAPNVPGARYTKSILAVLTAVLNVLVTAITGGISPQEWITIGISVLGALGVYAVSNDTGDADTSPAV